MKKIGLIENINKLLEEGYIKNSEFIEAVKTVFEDPKYTFEKFGKYWYRLKYENNLVFYVNYKYINGDRVYLV